jgi:hypothetical protein
MATVIVDGVYMGHSIKQSEYDGKKNIALYIDLYQPDSMNQNNLIRLKSDDINLSDVLNKEYTMGMPVRAYALVNAYKNTVYFKLIKLETK